jgi:hypothetical protein
MGETQIITVYQPQESIWISNACMEGGGAEEAREAAEVVLRVGMSFGKRAGAAVVVVAVVVRSRKQDQSICAVRCAQEMNINRADALMRRRRCAST